MIYALPKRIFDIALALSGLLIFFPLLALIAFLIFLQEGRPIFYIKKTVGKDKKFFYLLKFRSMKNNSQIVTKLGRILRGTAMDELPQLINILKGEMSFVGPRPYAIEKYKALEKENFLQRLSVTPGLTGIAQIFAPKHASNDEVLKYDLEYIKRKNFFLDLYLIFISVWITLRGTWESAVKKL